MAVNPNSMVLRSDNLLAQSVDEDIVILDTEKGVYYGIENIGSRIWQLIVTPISARQICQMLIEDFAVDRETCEHDVLAFLEMLLHRGLIEIHTAGPLTLDEP
jgi:hypothetical protein